MEYKIMALTLKEVEALCIKLAASSPCNKRKVGAVLAVNTTGEDKYDLRRLVDTIITGKISRKDEKNPFNLVKVLNQTGPFCSSVGFWSPVLLWGAYSLVL